MTGADQHQRDAADVIAPILARLRLLFIEVELARLIHQERTDTELPIQPWRDRGEGGELECGRQHKTVIVVGVLTDQVDAPRRAVDPRLLAEGAAKRFGELANIAHGPYSPPFERIGMARRDTRPPPPWWGRAVSLNEHSEFRETG